jgi:hypothetical protein
MKKKCSPMVQNKKSITVIPSKVGRRSRMGKAKTLQPLHIKAKIPTTSVQEGGQFQEDFHSYHRR